MVQNHLFMFLAFFTAVDGELCFHCILKVNKCALHASLKFTAPPVKMLSKTSIGELIN